MAEEVTNEATEHGYKDYETYVAEGNDPDMFRGPKAFMQWKEREDDWKSTKKDMQDAITKANDTMIEMTSTFTKADKDRVSQHEKELDAAIEKAREERDFEGYDAAVKAKAEAAPKEDSKEKPKEKGEAPVILKFRSENPLIDFASSDFNQTFSDALQTRVNRRAFKVTQKNEGTLSELEMQTIMKDALKETSKDFPHLFTKRKVPDVNDPGNKKPDKKDVKLDEAQQKMQDHLKVVNPKAAKAHLESIVNG